MALFLARAHEMRHHLVVDADTAVLVHEVCLSLDGLPLAIELAAARVNVLPLPALLPHLATLFPGGTATTVPRIVPIAGIPSVVSIAAVTSELTPTICDRVASSLNLDVTSTNGPYRLRPRQHQRSRARPAGHEASG